MRAVHASRLRRAVARLYMRAVSNVSENVNIDNPKSCSKIEVHIALGTRCGEGRKARQAMQIDST
jgi:hypothetical protein